LNPFRPRRVRIVEAGWADYTGHLGPVEFKGGVSVDPVSHREQQTVGSIIRVESADEGEDDAQLGPAAELIRGRSINADDERVLAAGQSVSVGEHGEVRLAVERYTREELEAVADRRGITGLRDIASPYGVKGRGITELINEILQAQNKGDPAPATERVLPTEAPASDAAPE
jgi:hypothetical protein